ncbi:MAG: WG repeat-containing protein [Bacteroidota bacterium]
MKPKHFKFPVLLCAYLFTAGCSQSQETAKEEEKAPSEDYLVMVYDEAKNQYGYKNSEGKMTIPFGKYEMCFTDTLRDYAVVATSEGGLIAIDKNEKKLYDVFVYDNGPDYPSEGLFRFMKGEKIGYADAKTGKIVIDALYACAWPFEDGKAKVSTSCTKEQDGENTIWLSENWVTIDREGKEVK